MTYRVRTLITAAVALVLLAGLCTYAYLGVYVAGQRERRDEVLGRLVFDLEPAQVRRIQLETPGERAVVERSAAGEPGEAAWTLREPVQAEADGLEVEGILSTLQLLDYLRRIPAAEAEPPRVYGLEKPRVRWELELQDGRRLSLKVGKLNALTQLLYAQAGGSDDVLILAGRTESALERTAFDLRRKDLVRFEPEQVLRLRLEGGEARRELVREGGRWLLTAPLKDRADPRAVNRVLTTLRGLRATGFPPAELPDAALGMDQPLARVSVEGAAPGVRLEVWIGKGSLKSNEDKLFARRVDPPGPTVQVGLHVLPVLQAKLFELRERRLLEFDPAAVARIRASAEGQVVVLERRAPGAEGGWDLVSPVAAPARRLKVQAVLGALGDLSATRILAPGAEAEHGLLEPQRSLVLLDAQGAELASLRVGRTTPDGVAVKGSSRAEPCLVDPRSLADTVVEPQTLRDDGAGDGGNPLE